MTENPFDGLTKAQLNALRYFARTDGQVSIGRMWKSARVLEHRGLIQKRYQYSPFGSHYTAEVTEGALLALRDASRENMPEATRSPAEIAESLSRSPARGGFLQSTPDDVSGMKPRYTKTHTRQANDLTRMGLLVCAEPGPKGVGGFYLRTELGRAVVAELESTR